MNPLFGVFGLGYWELLIVAGVILLLFGHRLPSMMRSLGKGVTEFKKGISDVSDDIEAAADGKSKTEE